MISVILCTHDPRDDYLAQVIAGLKSQDHQATDWELVIIDNASRVPLAGRSLIEKHGSARVIREEKLGLTHSRLRGIREARGSVLVFVDDDNVLGPGYLSAVSHISDERPYLGAWSGTVRGEFEVDPPTSIRPYLGNLVIREVMRDSWSNLYGNADTTPLGAGMCVRRAAALEYLRLHDEGRRSTILDRAGGNLVSGGDVDLAACAIDIGLGTGQMSSLELTHLIPAVRLSEDYHVRLVEGITYSAIILESYRPLLRSVPEPAGLRSVLDRLRSPFRSRIERRMAAAIKRGRTRAQRVIADTA